VQKTNQETLEELQDESELEKKDEAMLERERMLQEKLSKADQEKSRAMQELKHLEQAEGIASMSPQRLHMAVSEGRNLTKLELDLQDVYDQSSAEIASIQTLKNSLFEKEAAIVKGAQDADPVAAEEEFATDDAQLLQDQIDKRKAEDKTTQINAALLQQQGQILTKQTELKALKESVKEVEAKEQKQWSHEQSAATSEEDRAQQMNLRLRHLDKLTLALKDEHRSLSNLTIRLDEESDITSGLVEKAKAYEAKAPQKAQLSVLSLKQKVEAQENDGQTVALKTQIQQKEKELSSIQAQIATERELGKAASAKVEELKTAVLQKSEARAAAMATEVQSLQKGSEFARFVAQSRLARAEGKAKAEAAAKLEALNQEQANLSFQLKTRAEITQAQLSVQTYQASEAEKRNLRTQKFMEKQMDEVVHKSNLSVAETQEAIHDLKKQLAIEPGAEQAKFRDFVKQNAVPVDLVKQQVEKTSHGMEGEVEDLNFMAKDAESRLQKANEAKAATHQRMEAVETEIKRIQEDFNDSAVMKEKEALQKKLDFLRKRKEKKLKALSSKLEQLKKEKIAASQAQKERAAVEQLKNDFDHMRSQPPQIDEEEDSEVEDVLKQVQGRSFVQLRRSSKASFLARAAKDH